MSGRRWGDRTSAGQRHYPGPRQWSTEGTLTAIEPGRIQLDGNWLTLEARKCNELPSVGTWVRVWLRGRGLVFDVVAHAKAVS